MDIVKLISVIFLAIFLIARGLEGILGLHLSVLPEFVVNIIGVASGILMLISMRNFYGYGSRNY